MCTVKSNELCRCVCFALFDWDYITSWTRAVHSSIFLRVVFACTGAIVWFPQCEWSWWRHQMETHDDVIKWKHFPRNWPFVRGIHRPPMICPHNSQWRGALMFSLISIWINDWVNNREAGDLRCYRTHYDVIVMIFHVTGPLCGEFTGEFPSQRPVMWSFDVFCAWIKGWVNNPEAGDLRHHRAHYDVIVIMLPRRMWGKSNGYKPQQNTAQCFYDTINFLQNPHNRHPIAHLWEQNMGCFLWVQNLIYVLLLLLHCYVSYCGILHHIIKAFNCTTNWEIWSYFLAWAVCVCFLL